ncbi:MAG: ROK family transcriptional regulator [Rhodoferax sp.]|nr:ROK family transcriptional regulator [Rhodoferax sp.]
MNTTGDQQLVKRINRSVLLRLLRNQPGLSRAQLAQASGLTKSTVSLLVRELMDESWLSETEVPATQGLGRPSTPLQLDGRSRGMVGVEVAVESLRVVGVSITGQVLCALEEPLISTQPEDVCRQAARLVARTHAQLTQRGVQLCGVGVGLPGAFDEANGMLRFAPNLGWRNIAFLALITQALQLAGIPQVPIHVQNEADTAALSEYEFSDLTSQDALIFVTCGAGVGAGIVLNDRLFTGMQGMAGEIGHSILEIDGPLCSCGRKGCAETFFGARALAACADPSTGGHYLGVVLYNLWTTFNPSLLVIGGPSCDRYPSIVQTAQNTLARYAQPSNIAPPTLRPARYGLLASAVGAAALVLHHLLRPMHPHFTTGLERAASTLSDTLAPVALSPQ